MTAHLKIDSGARFERALVCGAPERAERIASMLSGHRLVARNREYHSYVGKHQSQEILVLSHGVGSAGAAIAFEELFTLGVKTVVRVGTAGGLYDSSSVGDVVVATAAIREDGVSPKVVPLAFPAIADGSVTRALETAAVRQGLSPKSGIVLTSDLFYPGLLGTNYELYAKAGAIAVEMECATLFVLGAVRGVRTGAILSLDGNPLKWSEGHYAPHSDKLKQAVESAAQSALDALAVL